MSDVVGEIGKAGGEYHQAEHSDSHSLKRPLQSPSAVRFDRTERRGQANRVRPRMDRERAQRAASWSASTARARSTGSASTRPSMCGRACGSALGKRSVENPRGLPMQIISVKHGTSYRACGACTGAGKAAPAA